MTIKAMKAKEVPLEKLTFPMIAQLKFDGVRLITKITNNKPEFFTYNGSKVPLPAIAHKIRRARLDNVMLDGEIVKHNGKVGTRPAVAGLINSAIHGGTINDSALSYVLFDCMSLASFVTQRCTVPYNLGYASTVAIAIKTKLEFARNMIVRSIEEVQTLSEQVYTDGHEGLILKPINHMYRFSRSPNWVKIKETKTADLLCTGTTPGTGKYEDMIGALICEGKVEGKEIQVKVGSGLNDADRARKPAHYLGSIIEIKYNSIIQDKTTELWSLFLPRFVALRFDK